MKAWCCSTLDSGKFAVLSLVEQHLSTRGQLFVPMKLTSCCSHSNRDLSVSQIKHGHIFVSDDIQRFSQQCLSTQWDVYWPELIHPHCLCVCAAGCQVGVQPFCHGRCQPPPGPSEQHPPAPLFYLMDCQLSSTSQPEPDWSHALSHTNKPYQHLIQLERDHDRDTEGEPSRDCVRTWSFSCLQNL